MNDLKDQDEAAFIALRFKLRGMLRTLVDRINVYPGGFKDKGHVAELNPPGKRKIFYEGIDNKDFRFYQVHLKGCRTFKRGFYPLETGKKLKELERKREEKKVGFPM